MASRGSSPWFSHFPSVDCFIVLPTTAFEPRSFPSSSPSSCTCSRPIVTFFFSSYWQSSLPFTLSPPPPPRPHHTLRQTHQADFIVHGVLSSSSDSPLPSHGTPPITNKGQENLPQEGVTETTSSGREQCLMTRYGKAGRAPVHPLQVTDRKPWPCYGSSQALLP